MIRRWIIPVTVSLAIHAGVAGVITHYLGAVWPVPAIPYPAAAVQTLSARVDFGSRSASRLERVVAMDRTHALSPAPAKSEFSPPASAVPAPAPLPHPSMPVVTAPPESLPLPERKADKKRAVIGSRHRLRRSAARDADSNRRPERLLHEDRSGEKSQAPPPRTVDLAGEGGPPGDTDSTVGVAGSHGPAPLPSNAPPEYPEESRRLGHAGVVTVRAVIDTDGSVASARIVRSSGYDALDRAALTAVRHWRFTPAVVDGAASRCEISVPVKFVLRD
jgi:protein TonB